MVMNKISPPLDAVLSQWSAQSNASPDQVAQLRAALIANNHCLEQFNDAAESGRLKDLALVAMGGKGSYAGRFDPSSGAMQLPASSFQATGAMPSDDLKVTVAFQAMMMEFSRETFADEKEGRSKVTPAMTLNLQDVINSSPVLADELKRSIGGGYLERFAILDPRMGAGGTYNDADKSLSLPPDSLADPPPPETFGKKNGGNLTFVMGHEIQHSFNQSSRQEAWKVFQQEIEQIAKSRPPEHDYSGAVSTLLHAVRWDEARAEVAGWNALASRASLGNPNPTFTDVYSLASGRANDFAEYSRGTKIATPIPGFAFNADHSLDPTPENIEKIAHAYFDRPPAAYGLPGPSTNLGFHNESDYTNYYARGLVERIIQAEQQYAKPVHGEMPKLVLDMDGLGLNRSLIERQGLSVGQEGRHEYYDTSQPQPKPTYFHHTKDGVNDHQFVPPPITPSPAVEPPQIPARLDDTAHPDNAFYCKTRDLVHQLDQQNGRTPDQRSDQLAAALTVQARADGLQRIDQVALSQDASALWGAQRPPGVRDHFFDKHCRVDTVEGLNTPMEQSSAKWPQAMEQFQQQEQAQKVQQQQAQDLAPHQEAGMRIR